MSDAKGRIWKEELVAAKVIRFIGRSVRLDAFGDDIPILLGQARRQLSRCAERR